MTSPFGPARDAPQVELDPVTVDHPVLNAMLQMWNSKCAGRAMPSRADFSPRELKDYLGWIFLVDVLENDYRYRVVGSHITRYFLGHGTGKTLTQAFEGFPAEFANGITLLYQTVCAIKRPLRMVGPCNEVRDVFFPEYDSLYLPLSDDGERVNMLMGVFVFDANEVRARARMSLAGHA